MTETKIYQALLEAQKKIEPITKDATAGTSFKYNYATLGAVLGGIKAILLESGLFISQPIKGDKVFTIVYHSNGESISDDGTQIICAKANDPQAQGSAISYARRYGLMSLLCLSAEDDDGAKAMPHASSALQGQTTAPKSASNDYGKCPRCGAPNKWSTLKNKAYCGAMCWNNPPKTMPDKIIDDIDPKAVDENFTAF